MNELLQFEKEKCQDPRRFPMYFRLKLDLCGIKLSKRDWISFDPAEKERLLAMPCDTPLQIARFRDKLAAMIHTLDREIVPLPDELPPTGQMLSPYRSWTDRTRIPAAVSQHIEALGKPIFSLREWAALSDLQRFALIKLTQPGHLKEELRLALEEFALLPKQTSASLAPHAAS